MAVEYMKIILLLLSAQGCPSVYLDVSPKYRIAKVGETVTVLCKAGTPLDYCRVKMPNDQVYSLKPNKPSISDVSYYGAGFTAGECGVKIERVQEKYNGQVTCSVATDTDSFEASANMTLVVASAPNPPELQLSVGSEGALEYKEGETVKATCVVRNGRPVANLTWFLGDEQIQEGVEMPTIYNSVKDDKHTIEQNLTRRLHASDNGKVLKCVADHPSLAANRNMDVKMITVKCEEPQPRLAGESSDTESADHGAPEHKSKVYFTSVFRKKSDKTGTSSETIKPDNAAVPLDPKHSNEGVVYAELDLQSHRPGVTTVVRGDDDKTEYAEIIHTKADHK